jgi:hypothetical protein
MSIPYGSDSVVIHGILSKLTTGDVVQICQVNDEDSMLEGVDSVPVTKEVPVEIQQLLHQYADMLISLQTRYHTPQLELVTIPYP